VAFSLGAISAAAILLALTLGGLRAAPNLRAVLGETPCAAPCWHQITPGQTRVSDAVQQIGADPAVEDLIVNVQNASWWWNGAQPAGLRGGSRDFDGRMLFASDAPDSTVDGLALMSSLTLGDLISALGPPEQQTLHVSPSGWRAGALYVADYGNWQAFALLSCPLRPGDFWKAGVGFAFGTIDFGLGGETWTTGPNTLQPLVRLHGYCAG